VWLADDVSGSDATKVQAFKGLEVLPTLKGLLKLLTLCDKTFSLMHH